MALLRRVDEFQRRTVTFTLDGAPVQALDGDTVLTAVLAQTGHLRTSEFSGGRRAGFCLMGACQDCFVEIDGAPQRACSTPLTDGMRIRRPDWSNR